MVDFCNYTVHTFSDLCLHIRINASEVSVPKRVLRKRPNSNAVSLSYLTVRAPERLDLQHDGPCKITNLERCRSTQRRLSAETKKTYTAQPQNKPLP